MLVLGVCSLKGGVGKTSVTLGLASAALGRGVRTLVIDLDPQADATTALGAPIAGRLDVAAVLDDPRAWNVERAVAASSWAAAGLDVMVGSTRSAAHDGPTDDDVERLAFALTFVSGYDLVLIDCPPSLGALTRVGLAACDRALVVTEPGLFSVLAVKHVLGTIEDIGRTAGRRLQPLGIVVNRVHTRSTEQTYRLDELRSTYGELVLFPTIPERSVLRQAQGAGRGVHTWPGRPAAELADAFDQLLDRALRTPLH